jgi:hypothetical protein
MALKGSGSVANGSRYRRRRNSFKVHLEPTTPMSAKGFSDAVAHNPVPGDLQPFSDWFLGQESARERFAWVLRDSLNELLDGQRTGRWCYQHLSKTEKTHLGTIVEVNLTKEFDLDDGHSLDWSVAGQDLDCKFSKDFGGWEVPMEMYLCDGHGPQSGRDNHPALLVWMDDDRSQWAAGLIRITDDKLRWRVKDGELVRAYNRDFKRRISDEALADVFWLWGGRQDDLPTNTLLHMDDKTRARIFSLKSGQQRVNELFRARQRQLISRATVMTVAQQDDGMKRARDARLHKHLGKEGILVLGHQDASPHIAALLGLTVPLKGEFVACRVAPVSSDHKGDIIHVEGQLWGIAGDEDPIVPAPDLPDKQPSEGWIDYLSP